MEQVLVIDYDKHDYKIKFLGEEWITIGGGITTLESFKQWCSDFMPNSFAHIYPDGRILRHGIQIGTVDDITVLELCNVQELLC